MMRPRGDQGPALASTGQLGGRAAESLLEGFPADAFPVVRVVRLEGGQRLYREGDAASSPFVVVDGSLRLCVGLADAPRLVDVLGTGDVLGAAALDGGLQSETVDATETGASLLELDLTETLRRRGPREAFVSALVGQVVRSRRLADDLGLPMGARICRILARLAMRLGESVNPTATIQGGGAWVHLPFNLTHDDVASLAGCARVTVTRVLGDLKDEGVLGGARGNYSLVPSALLEMADRYVWEAI